MGAAESWRPLPSPSGVRAKVVARPSVEDNVVHMRSPVRKAGRIRSRELAKQAVAETRCLVIDLAEAMDVDERGASRALAGAKPIDIGDILCLASTGPGGLRAARRLVALLRDELDRIEASHD